MFNARIKGGDLKGFKKISKELREKLKGLTLGVGIWPESRTMEGRYVAEYATYNEYGTKTIPARPFLRQAQQKNQDGWAKIIRQQLMVDSTDAEGAFILAGEVASKDVMAEIESGNFTPLSQKTIDAKQRAGKKQPETPLIDTGTMMEAISYKVEKE